MIRSEPFWYLLASLPLKSLNGYMHIWVALVSRPSLPPNSHTPPVVKLTCHVAAAGHLACVAPDLAAVACATSCINES